MFSTKAYHECFTTEVVRFCTARRGVNCGYEIEMRTKKMVKRWGSVLGGLGETHANRSYQLSNKFRPRPPLHHSRRGGNRWLESKTICHRIWLDHPMVDYYFSLLLFSCFPWLHRALCAIGDHIYWVGSKLVKYLEFLLLGQFLLFVLLLLL